MVQISFYASSILFVVVISQVVALPMGSGSGPGKDNSLPVNPTSHNWPYSESSLHDQSRNTPDYFFPIAGSRTLRNDNGRNLGSPFPTSPGPSFASGSHAPGSSSGITLGQSRPGYAPVPSSQAYGQVPTTHPYGQSSYAAPPLASGLSSPAHGQIPTYPYRPSDPQIPHDYGSNAPFLPAGPYHALGSSTALTGTHGQSSYAAPPSGLSSPAHGQIPTYPYRPSDPQIPHVYGSYAPTHPYHGLPAGTYVSGSSSLTGALGEHATSHPSGSGSSQAPTPHPYRSSPAAPGSSSGIAVGQSSYASGPSQQAHHDGQVPTHPYTSRPSAESAPHAYGQYASGSSSDPTFGHTSSSHIPVPAIGFQSPAQVTQHLGSQPPTHSSHPQTIAFSTPDPPDHGKGKTRATASISTRRKLEDAAKEAMRKRKRQQEEAYRKRIRAKHPDRLCTICDQYIPAPTGKKPSMSQHINVNHPSHLRSTINDPETCKDCYKRFATTPSLNEHKAKDRCRGMPKPEEC